MAAEDPTAYGLSIMPLPEGHVPLEAIVVVKTLNAEGDPTLEIRCTEGVGQLAWDRVGMLQVACDVTREQAMSLWRPSDDDE